MNTGIKPRTIRISLLVIAGMAGCWLMLWPATARGDGIVNTKHNLSVSSPGAVKAETESEICIFCHTPHNGAKEAPMWNHASSGVTYIPYSSTTTKAKIGQPTGDSKLCLSCHDGTVAPGLLHNRKADVRLHGLTGGQLAGVTRLGTDLSDDHPISFTYDSSLAALNGQLYDPSTLKGPVRLDGDHQVQCTTCHNPHQNQYGKMLVMNNEASALCTACHNEKYWGVSSHASSPKTWNGTAPNPWPHTGWTTVFANGCENCHRPHSAGTKQRLLNNAVSEQNCYPCHNGNVASKNIEAEFRKFSIHPVPDTSALHDPAEDPVNSARHTACADCHNPHAVNSTVAQPPQASGGQAGLTGVGTSGTIVSPLIKEYELCFRCHADSPNRGPARVTRQYVQTNTRLNFQTTNASYHPVETTGKNPNVPSLILPWTTGSMMYCTDCHNNNQGPGAGGVGPNGPHGSAYVPILERRLELIDNQAESSAVYALCYKCHSRNSILSNQSFSEHSLHVVDVKAACTTCHDSHGVEFVPHLINFNTTYVTKSSNGRLEYVSTGPGAGNCSLTCHGVDHQTQTYPTASPPALRRYNKPFRH
jgi:predicted CXXCH cytochrome family protein